ncbi:MAG: S24 family peptidase [Raoultibacter sp.]
MGISSNIKKYRTSKYWIQEQLTERLGVTLSTVTQWETRWSQPRIGAVEKLAAIFEVSVADIGSHEELSINPSLPNSAPKRAYLPLCGQVRTGDAQELDIRNEKIPLPYEVWERHRSEYFFEVEGNCMSKVCPPDCYVLVDVDKEPQNGTIAVASIDGADYVLRRLHEGAK